MKKSIIGLFILCASISSCFAQDNIAKTKLSKISKKEFKAEFMKSKNFEYNGTQPILVDFNATWCKPCKKIHPILEELQAEYGDKITFYSIDIDQEANKDPDYPTFFNFDKIPTILLIEPGCKEKPTPISIGGITKDELRTLINSKLLQ